MSSTRLPSLRHPASQVGLYSRSTCALTAQLARGQGKEWQELPLGGVALRGWDSGLSTKLTGPQAGESIIPRWQVPVIRTWEGPSGLTPEFSAGR